MREDDIGGSFTDYVDPDQKIFRALIPGDNKSVVIIQQR